MIEQEVLLLNPFPGLRAFRTKESELFFGRDGQSDQVLTKLRAARFVAVVGTSGSGKSSLVSAGLLPALLSGHMPSAGSSWRIASFRPGSSPIRNLAEALSAPDVCGTEDKKMAGERLENIERTLRRSSIGLLEVVSQSKLAAGENLLILADQFEELFRFRKKSTAEHPEDEAAAFVKLLLEAKQPDKKPGEKLPIYVILTMRSDYLGDCAHFWGLPEAINEGQFLIPRMTDDNRREAIIGPVIMGGGEITAPLVNRLLNDAGDDPAQLPILQHALMRTWDYWKNGCNAAGSLDTPHYQKIGGMTEALSIHADEAFLDLSPQLQEIASKVFKSLTEKEADNREGRRPATVGEIAAAAEATEEQVRTVIESFRREDRSFLMPPPPEPLTSDKLIDISHESLIRGWVRLRAWVDEEAEAARQYIRLAETAALFPDQESYLRDPALSNGLKWLKDNKPTKAWAERYDPGFDKTIEYLELSKQNRQAEIDEKERAHKEKVEQELRHAEAIAGEQKRRVKQLRWGLALMALLLVGMFSVTVYAFRQKRHAEEERGRAETAATYAREQKDRAEGALMSAQVATAQARIAQEEAANQRDVADEERKKAEKQTTIAQAATVEADRQKGVAVKALGSAKTEADNARKAKADAVTAQDIAEAEKTRALKLLATVKEIDLSPAYAKAAMRGSTQGIKSVAFSPDGRYVVTASNAQSVRLFETDSGDEAAPLSSLNGLLSSATFSHDGKLVAAAGVGSVGVGGGEIHIWDLEKSSRVRMFGTGGDLYTPGNIYSSVVFSPDDKWIAAIANARRPTRKSHHGTSGLSSPELETNDLNFVELRSVSGDKVLKLLGHSGNINSLVFSHDGKHLVTASADSTARVWDTTTGKSVVLSFHSEGGVNHAEFSPDDKLVVTAGNDRTAHVWNAETGEILVKSMASLAEQKAVERSTLNHSGPVSSAHFSADGKYIVTTSGNNAYLWSAELSDQWTNTSTLSPTIFEGHEGLVTDAVFSPDGKWVVTISDDWTARVWRAQSVPQVPNKPLSAASVAVFRGHIKRLTTVGISKDSKYVVTGGDDRTARVWNLTDISAFSVTATEPKAEPAEYAGKCPVTLQFTGSISVSGNGGTVKYRFVRSDGAQSLPQELVFDGPGSKSVSTTWTLLPRGIVSRAGRPIPYEDWQAIEILEPIAMKSKQAEFKVLCEESGAQQFTNTPLTTTQLAQIMPQAPAEKIALYLPYIQKAMDEFGINTPLRRAEFLAEVARESVELRVLEELGSGAAYENRKDLGNYEPGDGPRFKGRGAFQLTGRANYQRYAAQLGVDLIAQPELAASPEVAFRTAALFWQSSGLNELADKGDTKYIRRKINGGTNGLEEVLIYSKRAREALGAVPPVN